MATLLSKAGSVYPLSCRVKAGQNKNSSPQNRFQVCRWSVKPGAGWLKLKKNHSPASFLLKTIVLPNSVL